MAPLARDVMMAYASRTAGAAPQWEPLPGAVRRLRALAARAARRPRPTRSRCSSQQIAHWRDALAGLPDLLELPPDRPRPARTTARRHGAPSRSPAELARRSTRLRPRPPRRCSWCCTPRSRCCSPRLTGADDIAVGTPVAGRGEAALDDLVGMFVNTLVLRTPIAPAATFAEVLATTREADLQAFSHADVPFERLVEVLNPDTVDLLRAAVPGVARRSRTWSAATFELPGLTVEALDVRPGRAPSSTCSWRCRPRATADGTPDGYAGVFTLRDATCSTRDRRVRSRGGTSGSSPRSSARSAAAGR